LGFAEFSGLWKNKFRLLAYRVFEKAGVSNLKKYPPGWSTREDILRSIVPVIF